MDTTNFFIMFISGLIIFAIILYVIICGLLPSIKFKNTEYPIDIVEFKATNLSKEMFLNE